MRQAFAIALLVMLVIAAGCQEDPRYIIRSTKDQIDLVREEQAYVTCLVPQQQAIEESIKSNPWVVDARLALKSDTRQYQGASTLLGTVVRRSIDCELVLVVSDARLVTDQNGFSQTLATSLVRGLLYEGGYVCDNVTVTGISNTLAASITDLRPPVKAGELKGTSQPAPAAIDVPPPPAGSPPPPPLPLPPATEPATR